MIQKCIWYVLSCGHVEWKNFEKLCNISTTYHVNICSLWTQKQTGCWHSWTYWWPESLTAIEDIQKENHQFGPLSSCSHTIMHHQNMEFFYIPCAHQVCDTESLTSDTWGKHFNGIVTAMQISTQLRIRDVGWQCRRDRFCWSQYHSNIQCNVGSPDG